MAAAIRFPMGFRWARRDSRQRWLPLVAGCLLVLGLQGHSVGGEAAEPAPEDHDAETTTAGGAESPIDDLARRLQRLEQQNAALSQQNQTLIQQLDEVTNRYDQLNQRLERMETGAASDPALPVPAPPSPGVPSATARPQRADSGTSPTAGNVQGGTWGSADPARATGSATESESAGLSRFLVGERDDDRGEFVLVRPRDSQRVPFELRFDLFTEARYLNFDKSADSWVDSTKSRLPIRNYSSFEITRNFLRFSGYGLDPRLQFSAFIFSSTAINDTVYLGWINYHFSDALDVRVGNWAVPGTREWYDSFRWTMGADRLMATTFFRPNISPGIWVQGEPIKNVHYVAMLANSLNRFTQGIERIGEGKSFGGTVWWDPLGDYGPGPSDIENNRTPKLRLGVNMALSKEKNQSASVLQLGNPEDTILRLSDGTPLFRPGALGPGVELLSASVRLWTVDAAVKYRGLGLAGEYFFRSLGDFQPVTGRVPFGSLFDQGGLLQAGYFVIPTKLEPFVRTSFVTGHFGGGNEVGGGLNWYIQGNRAWRLTFEVLRIDQSPAQNILTGYRAGESGLLYQLQWFTDF